MSALTKSHRVKNCVKNYATRFNSASCYMTGLALLSPAALAFDYETAETIPEVVVTSTKIEVPAQYSTQSATIITEQEIRERNFTDTTQILRQLGGIQLTRSGGPGQFTSVKARGLPAAYFLVIVDGVKINEGLSSGAGHFLGQINPKLIERIEILRGPEADLYGADSVAGVIVITTKGALPEMRTELGAEYGSLDWKQGYGSVRGTQGDFGYALNMAYVDSDGVISHESYRNFSPHLKANYKQGDWLSIEGSLLYMNSNFSYAELRESYSPDSPETPWWGFQLPDPNQYNENKQTIGSLNFKHRLSDNLRHKALIGWTRKTNNNRDLDDGLLGVVPAPHDGFTLDYTDFHERGAPVPVYDLGSKIPYSFRNENFQVDYNLLLDTKLSAGKNTLLFGYEYYKQEGKKWGLYGDLDADNYSNSFYINDVLTLLDDALVLRAGLRNNDDNKYGNHTTGKIGAAYTFKETESTLYGNYGTSFKAPSFFELVDPLYGNPNVQPEEGRTVELGVRQAFLGKRVNLEATYWHTKLDDMIAFIGYVNPDGSYGGTYINRDTGESQGVELVGTYWLDEYWSVNGNYTYTDSWGESEGQRQRAVQVAYNTANLGLTYQQDGYSLGTNVYYTGPRLRWAGDKEAGSFTTVSLFGRANVSKEFTLYGRVDNLFDANVTEQIGYKQPGIYGIVGVEWKL